MHHRRDIVRAACSAQNAYNPALALTSALLGPCNDAASKRTLRYPRVYTRGGTATRAQRRTLSQVLNTNKSAQTSADIEDGDKDEGKEMQKRKPQRKGTFAGYEALMGSVGNVGSRKQGHAEGSETTRDWSPTAEWNTSAEPPQEQPFENTPDPVSRPLDLVYRRPKGFGRGPRERRAAEARNGVPAIEGEERQNDLGDSRSGPPKYIRPKGYGGGRRERERRAEAHARGLNPDAVGVEEVDSSLRRVVSIPVSETTRKGHAAAMKSNDDAVAEFADRKRKEPRATGSGQERTVRGSFEDKLRRLDDARSDTGGLADVTHRWSHFMRTLGEQAHSLAQQSSKRSQEEIELLKEKMDYKGTVISPEQSPLDHELPVPWAVKPTGGRRRSAILTLDQEIALFAEHIQPTPAESAAREAVRDEVYTLVNRGLTTNLVDIELFGSERTGLSTTTSDLDFRLSLKPGVQRANGRDPASFLLARMKNLTYRLLKSPDWIAPLLRHSRYPIINAQHRQTGLDVQIVASPSTAPQQHATLHYLSTIPNLKPLYLVVRSMFGIRGLVDVFNGGTGSYGLLMLLAAALTRRGAPRDLSPGEQLLHFLDFYSTHDFARTGLALSPVPSPEDKNQGPPVTTPFRKHAPAALPAQRKQLIAAAYARADPVRAGQWSIGQIRPFQPYLPCIQDPANPLNDLGRKTNAVRHVVATLQAVRREMREMMGSGMWREEGGSLLMPAVGRVHEVYAERRRRVEGYGRGVLRGEVARGDVGDKVE